METIDKLIDYQEWKKSIILIEENPEITMNIYDGKTLFNIFFDNYFDNDYDKEDTDKNKVLELLIKYSSDNAGIPYRKNTSLMHICKNDYPYEFIKPLLENGKWNNDYINSDGENALTCFYKHESSKLYIIDFTTYLKNVDGNMIKTLSNHKTSIKNIKKIKQLVSKYNINILKNDILLTFLKSKPPYIEPKQNIYIINMFIDIILLYKNKINNSYELYEYLSDLNYCMLNLAMQDRDIIFIVNVLKKDKSLLINKTDSLGFDLEYYLKKFRHVGVLEFINKIKALKETEEYEKYKDERQKQKSIVYKTSSFLQEHKRDVCFDPFSLEEYSIKEWLNLYEGNIIFEIDSKFICSNLFLIKDEKYIEHNTIVDCIKIKGIVSYSESSKGTKYISLNQLGINNDIIEINSILKDRSKIIKLNRTNKTICGVHLLYFQNHPQTYGFAGRGSIAYDREIENALTEYTYKYDRIINLYLRTGEIRNIKVEEILDMIKLIDFGFNEAPKAETENSIILYRGIKDSFVSPIYDGIIDSYISTSKNIDSAYNFVGEHGCIYKYILDIGVPYIEINLSQFKDEEETLLPRGLKSIFIRDEEINGSNVHVILISLLDEDQFGDIKCNKYNINVVEDVEDVN